MQLIVYLLVGIFTLFDLTVFDSSPVTALAASFSPVPPLAVLKKCEAYFFKGEKAAAVQLRSLPAVEAKPIGRTERIVTVTFSPLTSSS